MLNLDVTPADASLVYDLMDELAFALDQELLIDERKAKEDGKSGPTVADHERYHALCRFLKVFGAAIGKAAVFLFALSATACSPAVVSVGTWNIRVDTPEDGVNAWEFRKDTVIAELRALQLDVIGLQEVMPSQSADINQYLVDEYHVMAFELEAQHNLLLVRRDTLEPDNFVEHTLLPTPADPSRRTLLTVELVLRHGGGGFVFGTTHAAGDRPSLELIRDALPTRRAVLTGDFNALPGANPWNIEPLQSIFTDHGWRDAYAEAHPNPQTRESSGCGWDTCIPAPGVDARIDWVLATRDLDVVAADILKPRTPSGRNASDHRPVIAFLELP